MNEKLVKAMAIRAIISALITIQLLIFAGYFYIASFQEAFTQTVMAVIWIGWLIALGAIFSKYVDYRDYQECVRKAGDNAGEQRHCRNIYGDFDPS